MQDAIDDNDDRENVGMKRGEGGDEGEGANCRVAAQDARDDERGKARARSWAKCYGNLWCEGMCCSLEAVGGHVVACIHDSPDKGKCREQDAGCVRVRVEFYLFYLARPTPPPRHFSNRASFRTSVP